MPISNCKCNFKLHSMTWGKFPIYNGTLESLIKYELDIKVFLSLNCLFSFVIPLQEWRAHLLFMRNNGEINRKKHFTELEKRRYLSHLWSDLGFKGTVVNRTLPSLHEGSLCNNAYSPFKVWKIRACGVPFNELNRPKPTCFFSNDLFGEYFRIRHF